MNLFKLISLVLVATVLSGCGSLLDSLFKSHPVPVPAVPNPTPQVLYDTDFASYAAPAISGSVDILLAMDFSGGSTEEAFVETKIQTFLNDLAMTGVDYRLTFIDGSKDHVLSAPTAITPSTGSALNAANTQMRAIASAQQTEANFDAASVLVTAAQSPVFQNFFRANASRVYFVLSSKPFVNSANDTVLNNLDQASAPGIWTLYSLSTDTLDPCVADDLAVQSSGSTLCDLNSISTLFQMMVQTASNPPIGISFRDLIPYYGTWTISSTQTLVNGNDWSSLVTSDNDHYRIIFPNGSYPPVNSQIQIRLNFSYHY